jgi:uncharacterized protein (TIGR01777 family)
MNIPLIALQLMAAQGVLGAFDTLYHHELTEALPQRATARLELFIHATRALIYSLLFVGLSAWEWHGTWAIVLLAVFGVELVLTLWDFVVEDRTRLLPATERVTHTVLAVNGGAFIALLAIHAPVWLAQPTGFAWHPYGPLSFFLALCGIGVGASGLRDGWAAINLGRNAKREKSLPAIRFGDGAEQVLVTGATGFIGQLLVRALLADGKPVIVLSRTPKSAAWIFDGRVRCIARMDDLPSSQAIDVIINLAGARILGWRWTARRKAALLKSRVALTDQLVAWIAKSEKKPRLFLSASAIGYYGIQEQGDATVLTEESPPQPIFMSQLCQTWESAARAAASYGVQVICMRFGLVLGHQGALPGMMMPVKLGLGGPLGSGRQWLSWIHVRDVLRGIAHLWNRQAPPGSLNFDVYNFTAPGIVSQQQFSRTAAEVTGRPCVFPTPAAPVRMMLGEQADLLLEGQQVAPTRLQAEHFEFDYPDLRSALKGLM